MNGSPQPQHKRPLWLAALLAWPCMPVGFAAWILLNDLHANQHSHDLLVPILKLVLGYGLLLTGAATLLIGLPVAYWLRARGWLTAIPMCLTAAAAGAIAIGAFVWILDGSLPTPTGLLIGAAFGIASGVVFCLVAGLRWWPARP